MVGTSAIVTRVRGRLDGQLLVRARGLSLSVARHAWGLNTMTTRFMGRSAAPEEDWVDLTYVATDDQERLNEVQLYTTDIADETQGFRTILAAPLHPPYARFIPAPGHSLGFNDLKTIECRALIGRIRGEATLAIDFEEGVRIERTVDAIARSAREGTWIDVRA